MRLRLFLTFGFPVILLLLLGVSLVVVRQNQDNRQKAVNDVEFMQVTQATKRRSGKAQVAVVLNKLDPGYQYRLTFDLGYEKNAAQPGPAGNAPSNRQKTVRVSENKTYKFQFRADDCHYGAKLDIQLYYRESQQVWKPVNAPTAKGNTKLEYNCTLKEVTAATPAPVATPNQSTESAQLVPTPTPVPSPTPEVINDDSSLPEVDGDAQEIETLEDTTIIQKENLQATSNNLLATPTPSPTPRPSISPSPSSVALAATPRVSPTPRTSITPSATPRVSTTPRASATVRPSATPRPSVTPRTSPSIRPSPSSTVRPSPSSSTIAQVLTSSPTPSASLQPSPSNQSTGGGFGTLLVYVYVSPTPLSSATPTSTTAKKIASPTPTVQPSLIAIATAQPTTQSNTLALKPSLKPRATDEAPLIPETGGIQKPAAAPQNRWVVWGAGAGGIILGVAALLLLL